MATKAEEQNNGAGGEQTEKTPPTPAAPETKQPPAAPPPKVEAKTEQKPPEAGGDRSSRLRLEDDKDDIPEDAQLLELSARGLKSRLARHTKSQIKERFGTDNFDDIKAKLDKLAEYEKAEDEKKRAEMSEKERLENDLKKERETRLELERQIAVDKEDRLISKEEDRVVSLAGKHLDPDFLKDEDLSQALFRKFAKHLKANYSDDEIRGMKDEQIEGWFKEYAEKHPKYAKEAPKPPETEKTKVPLTNGAKGSRMDPKKGTGNNSNRSFAPSAENPMTTSEARAEAAKLGHRW